MTAYERCAKSLFEQTYPDLEYVFIDDCTPDRSIDVLRHVMDEYPDSKDRVRIIRHDCNRGLGAARNTALDNATGEFIIHVDSDDYIDRDAVRILVEEQKETDADIVTGNTLIVRAENSYESPDPHYYDGHSMVLAILQRHHYIWNRLIRLSLYNDHGIRVKEGINCCEDYQQTPRLAYYAKKVARVNDITYYYCQDNDVSYVHLYRYDYGIMLEALQSYMIIEKFFVDKGDDLYHLAHKRTAQQIEKVVEYSATCNDREYFRQMKDIVIHRYDDCNERRGWKRFLYRIAISDFHLYKYYIKITRLYGYYKSLGENVLRKRMDVA